MLAIIKCMSSKLIHTGLQKKMCKLKIDNFQKGNRDHLRLTKQEGIAEVVI